MHFFIRDSAIKFAVGRQFMCGSPVYMYYFSVQQLVNNCSAAVPQDLKSYNSLIKIDYE